MKLSPYDDVMTTASPSVAQLKRAIKIAEQIESLEAELAGILGRDAVATRKAGRKPAAAPAEGRKTKRKYNFSPEARAKIAAAQKARWARQKEAKGKK